MNMNTSPQIIEVEETLTAVIHLTVPREHIAKVMGPAIAELVTTITIQGSRPVGPLYTFHWQPPTDTFDFEVGFPISMPIEPKGPVKMGRLPAGRVATITYQGGYEGLAAAWSEFCECLANDGLTCGASSWEYYLVGAERVDCPEEFRTQLFKPVG